MELNTCETCGHFSVCDVKWNMFGEYFGWGDCGKWTPEKGGDSDGK